MAAPSINFNLTLPGGQVLSTPAWMDLNVTGSTNTNLIPIGNVGAFCASSTDTIYDFQSHSVTGNYNTPYVYNNATVYSSYDYSQLNANVPIIGNTLVAPETLHEVISEVNWLLDNLTVPKTPTTFTETLDTSRNATTGVYSTGSVTSNYYTITDPTSHATLATVTAGEVQDAIWSLLGNSYSNSNFINIGTVNTNNVNFLVNAAEASGANFTPTTGQHIALIIDAGVNPYQTPNLYQPLIVETTLVGLSGTVYADKSPVTAALDGTDTLLKGVTITLENADGTAVHDAYGNVVASVTTDANGNYSFGNLLAGSYIIQETQPTGYGQGLDTVGSQGGSATVQDQIVANLSANTTGAIGAGNNFGETTSVLVGNVTENGTGLSGVTLTLTGTDANGNPVSETATTGTGGSYSFANLLGGSYVITETPLKGNGAGTDSVGSQGGSTNGATVLNATLGAGVNGTGNNFTETLGSLSGNVTENGAALSGVTLTLTGTDANGHAVNATTTTASNGSYNFANLLGGSYVITETLLNGNGAGTDSVGSQGGSLPSTTVINATLGAGVNGTGNNFTETLGSLAGVVYADNSSTSGPLESTDTLLSNVTLALTGTDANGHAVSATTVTNASGQYSFNNLLSGNYVITETQPTGYGEGIDTLGSQGGSLGAQDVIKATLAAGQNGIGNNFGEVTKGCIDVLTFNDTNGTGTFQAGETGHAGMSVTLISLGSSGVFGSSTNTVVQTVTTGADGTYDFNNLAAGKYAVEVCSPTTSGLSFTTPSAVSGTAGYWGQNQNCWDGNTSNNPGSTDICYKATNPSTGSSSGTGLLIGDWNENGNSSGGEHTIYCSVSQAQAILASSDNGDARYGVAKEAITGWLNYLQTGTCDATTKADINTAVQWLCQHSSNQTTDWSGNGSLTLNADSHQVAYSSSDWHSTTGTYSGYGSGGFGCGGSSGSYTDGQTVADNLHNDNSENCNVQLVNVTAGPCATVNVGVQSVINSAACIEGTVFLDANGNGVLSAGEKGEGGVTVTLLEMSGSGHCDTTVATTTTDANGVYSFENLAAGQYQVTYSNPPSGYAFDQNNTGNGTAGYWYNHSSLWNGTGSGNICYSVTDPVSHSTGTGGILIGDFSHNGTGSGENVIYYSNAEIQSILGASTSTGTSDARYIVAKDVISEWMNTLQTGTCTSQQQTDISNAITWLQQHTPNENYSGSGDGNLTLSASSYACSTSSTAWSGSSYNSNCGKTIDGSLNNDITHTSVTQTLTVDAGQCTTNNVGVVQVTGPGCQSTNYWQSNTSIWDGVHSGNICYSVSDASAGGKPSLLIGDWNADGKTGSGESTICLSATEAQQILGCTSTDARVTVEKQLVTSWLNVLDGNSSSQTQSDINNAITWLKCNTGNGSGDAYADTSHQMSTTSTCFSTTVGTNPDAAHSGADYGQAIFNALNYYNTTGAGIAHDATGALSGDVVSLVGLQQYQSNFMHH